jgi:toxin ParE1/3/4
LEADAATAFYYRRNRQSSDEFLNGLANISDEIQKAPDRWPFEVGTTAQRHQMGKFPFTVFYLNNLHEVFILAVAHTSRRPGYWRTRIPAL